MRQVKASKTKLDVSEQIFDATDRLMAKEGLHHLSMHKLAKEAGIAAGTIYLYFKSKDELLAKFAHRVFNKFVVSIEEGFDENQSFFEQYRKMWWNIWHFLQENPTILSNMNQYQSLPEFIEIFKTLENSCWKRFCIKGQAANVLADLDPHMLFLLSLDTAIVLASDNKFLGIAVTDVVLESVIERSWRAIQK
ncbi:TetR family transcriptional regulator [Haemophilus sp. HMSC066D03]|uniref:TetR/AcrR family transcriptional regulator n=1 Tax=unclassified Haemophilus TaxID=2609962 RepID=UPI0008A53305|nr:MULTISPECIES: TetR/AcrR family transcriptional regulator [unclassified Haemophilus]OFS53225.1 TetR family transcriptional regulator [Haemophilus sp. HMSC066D03]OFS57701.1 TetR family transcriptional regulator [Haemophilus sp. HMSC066D02]